MTVLRRWRFWEYLPLLASVADCSWPRVSASLFSRKLSSALKKGGDRAKKRMRSQQESCCGLAFTGLNGLKLIWNSALALIAGEFSHIKHQVVSPSRLELKLLFEFASCCLELQLQVVSRFKSSCQECLILSLRAYIHTLKVNSTHNINADFLLGWFWCENSSHRRCWSWRCGLFLKVALIPSVKMTDLLACMRRLVDNSVLCKSHYSSIPIGFLLATGSENQSSDKIIYSLSIFYFLLWWTWQCNSRVEINYNT